MIKTFANKDARRLFDHKFVSSLPPHVQRKALIKLYMLDAAETLDDLRIPPGNKLEKLTGNRSGQYSIRINQQWRICVIWKDGNIYAVEIVDYHK